MGCDRRQVSARIPVPAFGMRSRFAAIDLGTTRNAVGAFASTSDSELVLVDFALFPLETGTGGEAAWLRQLEAMFAGTGPLQTSAPQTLLAPPPLLTLTKHFRVPDGASATAWRAEAARNIPYPLDEVAWDVERLGADPAGPDFALGALRLEIAEGLCAVARRHGHVVTRILPAGHALAAACRHNYPEIEGLSLVIEVGPRSCAFVFLGAGRPLLVRTMVRAANRAAERVAVGAGIGAGAADGSEPAGNEEAPDSEATPSLVARLAFEINRSMALLGRGSDGKPDLILVTGETVVGDDLVAQLAAKTGRPVERFDPLRRVRVAPSAAGAVAVAPQLAVVVGLAAAATDSISAGINLLPPRLRRSAARRKRQSLWLAGGALAAASLLPLAFGYWRAERICRDRAAWLEARIAPLRQLDQRNRAAAGEIASTRAEILRLQRFLAARASWGILLGDLQARLRQVDDAWLDRLEIEPPADPASGPRASTLFARPPVSPENGDGRPVRLRLAGRLIERQHATSRSGAAIRTRAANLVRALAGATFVASIEDERFDDSQRGILQFEVTLVLEQHAPL